jgi:hypothetical protein
MLLITYQGVPSFDTKTNSYGFDLVPNSTAMLQYDPEVQATATSPQP